MLSGVNAHRTAQTTELNDIGSEDGALVPLDHGRDILYEPQSISVNDRV